VVAKTLASLERAKKSGAREAVNDVTFLANIDAVVVATPTSTHFEVLSQVLDVMPGVPIYCEKALCDQLRDAEEINSRAAGSLFVMHKWRYQEGVRALKRITESKELGALIGIEATRHDLGSPHRDVDMIWTLLPHELSIVLHILGELPSIQSVVADRNERGAFGLKAILGWKPWVSLSVSGRANRARELKLIFEEGYAMMSSDLSHDEICIVRHSDPKGPAQGEPEIRQLPNTMPLFQELNAFVSFVRGESQPPLSSGLEAVEIVGCIEAMRIRSGIQGYPTTAGEAS